MSGDLLDDLLLAAEDELEPKKIATLHETDLFASETNIPSTSGSKFTNTIHTGDTDSSDDEGNRNHDQKYNESGRHLKHLLETEPKPIPPLNKNVLSATWKSKATNNLPKEDVYTDPIFGLRIKNPLISSAVLKERMVGREAVPFAQIARHIQVHGKSKDWVISGVVVNKSPVKTSQKGSQFSVWSLCDLKNDIKTVTLFLFSGAHQQLWKTAVGTVIGILNPEPLDKKDHSRDEAALSVNNAQKVMIFGTSKDFGTCKTIKKNGDRCTSIVNVNRCEHCIYHIKQEYQKCSQRSELQANFAGRGLTALRNKVLGKNEVFYAGKSYMAIPSKGHKKLAKRDDDRLTQLSRLPSTSSFVAKVKTKKGSANRLDVSQAQRIKDMELLKKLSGAGPDLDSKVNFTATRSSEVGVDTSKSLALETISKLKAKGPTTKTGAQFDMRSDLLSIESKTNFTANLSNAVSLDESRNAALSTIAKLKGKQKVNTTVLTESSTANMVDFNESLAELNYDDDDLTPANTIKSKENAVSKKIPVEVKNAPVLSGFTSKSIDLSAPITPKHVNRAKLNALKFVQRTGTLKKSDPNNVKTTKATKRPIINSTESTAKKSKLEENEFISDRFKRMMAATSKHLDAVAQHDDEEQEKYFKKLETKEKMEEKMSGTFKIACKAVRCLKCKYTSFSASDRCKAEKHPLKVYDAMKRFFKCGNCGNRTVSLDVVPIKPCGNCGSGKWERTGMMKEKMCLVAHNLSIRGGEQKFVNAVATNSHLDLLVPDE